MQWETERGSSQTPDYTNPGGPPQSRLAPVHMQTHTHTPSVAPEHVDLPHSLAPRGHIQIPHRLGKRTARTGRDGEEVTIPFKHDSLQFILSALTFNQN